MIGRENLNETLDTRFPVPMIGRENLMEALDTRFPVPTIGRENLKHKSPSQLLIKGLLQLQRSHCHLRTTQRIPTPTNSHFLSSK